MRIITNNFIIKLSRIVYDTPGEFTHNKNFKNKKLESYDNWKDCIIERVIKLIQKEL